MDGKQYNITKENAAEYQARAVQARLENAKKRNVLIDAGREIMNSRMKVNDKIKQAAAIIGYKLGRNPTFGEVAYITMMQKAVKDGNYKAFAELAKLSGLHFDQSVDALGGAENPINVQTTTVAPEQVKKISDELEGGC